MDAILFNHIIAVNRLDLPGRACAFNLAPHALCVHVHMIHLGRSGTVLDPPDMCSCSCLHSSSAYDLLRTATGRLLGESLIVDEPGAVAQHKMRTPKVRACKSYDTGIQCAPRLSFPRSLLLTILSGEHSTRCSVAARGGIQISGNVRHAGGKGYNLHRRAPANGAHTQADFVSKLSGRERQAHIALTRVYITHKR